MTEKKECFVCDITHNKWGENADLPDDQLEFVIKTNPDVQEKMDAGLCVLIEIEDPNNGSTEEISQLDSNTPTRTGRISFVSKDLVAMMFGEENKDEKQAFVSIHVMEELIKMSAMLAAKRNETNQVEQIPGDVAESIDFEELPNE